MKILLVNDYDAPIGGAEISILALREGLRKRGHDARLLASSARPVQSDTVADYECFGTTSRFRTVLQAGNPWAARRLRRVLTEFQPDVIHVMMFLTQLSPLILPLLEGVPTLYHVQWYRPVCPIGTKMLPDGSACRVPWGAACYRNHCLPLRDWVPLMGQMMLWRHWQDAFKLIVANSEAVRQRLSEAGIEPVTVVWNGVPVQPPRLRLSSAPTVVFAGRLVQEKGVDVLLRAFAGVNVEVPQARLLLIGDGPERPRLVRLVVELGLSEVVSMPGHLSREQMEDACSAAWVQVVPSRWAEPFGMVAAEAMMRGTAVVASNCGGLTEIVQDGKTGLLVTPGNDGTLAEALLRLIGDPELMEHIGRAGREFALKHFTEAAFVERFIRLYETLSAAGACHGS